MPLSQEEYKEKTNGASESLFFKAFSMFFQQIPVFTE